jgi:hypothetical protein
MPDGWLGIRGYTEGLPNRQCRGTWPDARWPPRNIASLPHLVLCRPSRVFVAVAGTGDGSNGPSWTARAFRCLCWHDRHRDGGLPAEMGAAFGSLGVFGRTPACLSICSISRPAGIRHWKVSQCRRPWEPFAAEPLPSFSGGAAGSADPESVTFGSANTGPRVVTPFNLQGPWHLPSVLACQSLQRLPASAE